MLIDNNSPFPLQPVWTEEIGEERKEMKSFLSLSLVWLCKERNWKKKREMEGVDFPSKSHLSNHSLLSPTHPNKKERKQNLFFLS